MLEEAAKPEQASIEACAIFPMFHSAKKLSPRCCCVKFLRKFPWQLVAPK